MSLIWIPFNFPLHTSWRSDSRTDIRSEKIWKEQNIHVRGVSKKFVDCLYEMKIPRDTSCADLEGGLGGSGPPPPWNLQSLISPILLEMKKISYFSYLCTSTVIRQGWIPPPPSWKNVLDPRLYISDIFFNFIFWGLWQKRIDTYNSK